PPRQRRAYWPPARASVAGDRPPDPNERPGPPPGRPPPPVALSIRGRSPRVRLRTAHPAGPRPRRPHSPPLALRLARNGGPATPAAPPGPREGRRLMRICKVWDAEYPWDVRVEKIARSLSEAGHTVHLVARNRDRRPTEEQLEECHVHRLAPLPPVL